MSEEKPASRAKDLALAGVRFNDDAELAIDRLLTEEIINEYNTACVDSRKEILKKLLNPNSSQSVIVRPPFRATYGYNTCLGENCLINFDCMFQDCGLITIGKNTWIGPGVHIYTSQHPLNVNERLEGIEWAEPVKIDDNVWIGGRAIICPGVTIGQGSTVGAGSVVVKNVPPNVVVVGNPAKIIRHLREKLLNE